MSEGRFLACKLFRFSHPSCSTWTKVPLRWAASEKVCGCFFGLNFFSASRCSRRTGALPMRMFFVASDNAFPASFKLVVKHEGRCLQPVGVVV